MTTFPEMRHWLARHSDLDDVFRRMVDVDDGTGCWFQASQSIGGGDEIWSSNGPSVAVTRSSASVLHDLHERGLLRIRRYRRGEAQYELPADARAFEQWRRQLPSPIQQVEAQVLHLVDDDGFADRHPDAAKHLRAAFALLADAPLDVPDTRIYGEHLRKALIDVAGASAGLPTSDEDLHRVFKPVRQAAARRGEAAVALLLDLCRAVLHLDHGVEHVSDEVNDRREPASPDTLRRAAFLTAMCCHELDRTPLTDQTGTGPADG